MTEIEQMIRERNMKEVAIAALKEGSEIDYIERITGLSRENIEELKEKHIS